MNSATYHFIAQRITALLLVPLGILFLFNLTHLEINNPIAVIAWIQKPHVMVLMLLFVTSLFYHAFLGIKSIIEDYIDRYRAWFIQAAGWLLMGCAGMSAILIVKLYIFGTSS